MGVTYILLSFRDMIGGVTVEFLPHLEVREPRDQRKGLPDWDYRYRKQFIEAFMPEEIRKYSSITQSAPENRSMGGTFGRNRYQNIQMKFQHSVLSLISLNSMTEMTTENPFHPQNCGYECKK